MTEVQRELLELVDVVQKLQAANSHLLFLRSEELRAKRAIWEQVGEVSQKARDDMVKYGTVDDQIAIWETETEIKNLTEQKFLLLTMLNQGRS